MNQRSRKEQLEDLLAEHPDDPFLRYGLAMEHVSAGHDGEAVRCFRDLRAITPEYVPAYLQEGQALVRLGRHAEARSVFAAGVRIAEEQGDSHAAGEMQAFMEGIV
jgi:Flp pilus assembly protein TadD